jgi:hypothetical protein
VTKLGLLALIGAIVEAIMGSEDVDGCVDEIAALALERLSDLISIMERAADKVASGGVLEEIEVGDYQLYVAEGFDQAIVCVWSAEEYFDLLEAVASDAGICLNDAEELIVDMPDNEFEESMVTGGFMAWKGFAVERKNRPLEELLDCVCRGLKARGLAVNCTDEEYVIFRLPVRTQDKSVQD